MSCLSSFFLSALYEDLPAFPAEFRAAQLMCCVLYVCVEKSVHATFHTRFLTVECDSICLWFFLLNDITSKNDRPL